MTGQSSSYLTVDEVAELSKFSPKTVRHWATQYAATKKLRNPKGLKGHKPDGRSWRFRSDDVHRFLSGS